VKGISRFSSPASSISLNTLTIVTFTKKGNVWRLYYNDYQIASTTSSIGINVNNNKMYLGYNFRGILDKVAIYPFALSADGAKAPFWLMGPRILFYFD